MRRFLVTLLLLASAPALAQAPFDKSGIEDWTKAPPPTAEPTFKPPVAKRSRLKNGMSLLLVENHALPIVSMRLVLPGAGGAADPASKGGLAAFTADLLDEGAGGLSAIAIAEETDRLGANIGLDIDYDAAHVSVSTLTKTLEPTLDLVTRIVTQPTFEAKEFERVKGDRMTSLELRRDRPREVARIVLDGVLFGRESPYGHAASGVREQFKGITVGDVQTFYKQRYNPATATLIVVGDFDSRALRKKLDASLARWKQPGATRAPRVAVKRAKLDKRLLLVDRKGAAQSDVRIGLVGLDRRDPRYYKFEVAASVFGGGFTSRFMQRLRETLGIIYNGRGGMEYRVATGPFVVSTAIVSAETAHGITETLGILDDLATTNVPAEELDKAKQNLIRALPAQFDTNSATAAAFAELVMFRLPDTWYRTYAANIRRVTARDVKAVTKAILPSKRMAISIVGDLSKIRASLDTLGLGEPAMFDAYGVPVAK